jgi:mannitol/fructose-specific phosphotransferase system IIA component (Ntr-type)
VTKVCSIAEEVRNPGRNIPYGMLAAHLTAMFIFSSATLVITGNVNTEALRVSGATDDPRVLTPVSTAAEAFWGPTGGVVMAVVAVVGLISMCNAGILSSSRFPFAMARDNLLPSVLARIHPRFATPHFSILLTGVLLVILVLTLPVVELAHLASGFKLFIFCAVNLSVIVFRETAVRWYQPKFRTPFYPWMQIAGIVGGLVLLVMLGTTAILGVLSAVVIGTVWYLAFGKRRVVRRSVLRSLWGEPAKISDSQLMPAVRWPTESQEMDALRRPTPGRRVIVPIFGTEAAPQRLLELGAAFVGAGILDVIRIEELPDQTALGVMLQSGAGMEELVEGTRALSSPGKIGVDLHHTVTHNAVVTLLQHAGDTEAEWIVMDAPTRRGLAYVVRHPMAWWLEYPPCYLAIFKNREAEVFDRILVLARPGPYDSLVVQISDRLAIESGGKLTLFLPVPLDADQAPHRRYHTEMMRLCQTNPDSLIIPTDDVEGTVRELTTQYDLLVKGAAPERGLRSLITASEAHRIAEAACCSVLTLKVPRDKVHHPLQPGVDLAHPEAEFERLVQSATIVAPLAAPRKQELFEAMARLMAGDDAGYAEELTQALWERERVQNTALSGGVQLSALTHPSISTTRIGVFLLAEPVPFRGPQNLDIDICILVLSPLRERQTQLWMLDRLSWLLKFTGLAEGLRAAGSVEEIRGYLMRLA